MMELIFATNNLHKVDEVAAVLGDEFRLVTLAECNIHEEIPEDAPTLEGNALQKARYIYTLTGRNCFADDTGLEVETLDGAPGVHSARYASEGHDFEANCRLLLKNMAGKPNRKARFRTVVALILDGREYLFAGVVNGRIIENFAGSGGFGYDPLFVPDGYKQTFAQMSPDDKNRISHRSRAIQNLVEFLHSLPK